MDNKKMFREELAEENLSSAYGVYEYTTFDNAYNGISHCVSSTNILRLNNEFINNMFVTCVNHQVSRLIKLGFDLIDTYRSTSTDLVIVDYKINQ